MRSYFYVDGEYEIRDEIKRSVFIATAKGEVDSDAAEDFVKSVKKKYPDATHHCYAYVSDELGNATRFSDDGEPSGTAGQPILDVLRKKGLVKTAIVVTRYFGGVKLGAGGLVGAYSGAASNVVAKSLISQKVECVQIRIYADYASFSAVEKCVKNFGCAVGQTIYGEGVECQVYVATDDVNKFCKLINEVSSGRAKVNVCDVYEYKNIE